MSRRGSGSAEKLAAHIQGTDGAAGSNAAPREPDALVLDALLRAFSTHAPDPLPEEPFVYWARIETRPGETLRDAVERRVREARVRAFFSQGGW